jgi:hypothetical protein
VSWFRSIGFRFELVLQDLQQLLAALRNDQVLMDHAWWQVAKERAHILHYRTNGGFFQLGVCRESISCKKNAINNKQILSINVGFRLLL